MSDRVLVTGASGFIAKHVIAELLASGYWVRGTVRALSRRGEIEAAVARALSASGQAAFAAERLELVEADLMRDAGWAEAVDGCAHVLHVASPFPTSEPKQPEDLIRPAREGTRRVIAAAAKAGVPRIVVTSSVVAVMHSARPDHEPRNEADWSDTTPGTISSYGLSKTLAEQAAWEAVREIGDGAPELTVINPGVVLGPALDKDLSASHVMLRLMGRGSYPALPKVAFPVVDVRDVAAMHVKAMSAPKAGGQRYLCADATVRLKEIGRIMVETLPDLKRKVPTIEMPSSLVRIAANFDRNLASIRGDLDRANLCDTSKARRELDFEFRPAREAIQSAALSLRQLGII